VNGRRSGRWNASVDKVRLAQHSGGTVFGSLQPHHERPSWCGARLVMVLLLDNFAAFNEKCVGDLQRLAVRQADLGLAGNPPTLTCVVTQSSRLRTAGKMLVKKSKRADRAITSGMPTIRPRPSGHWPPIGSEIGAANCTCSPYTGDCILLHRSNPAQVTCQRALTPTTSASGDIKNGGCAQLGIDISLLICSPPQYDRRKTNLNTGRFLRER